MQYHKTIKLTKKYKPYKAWRHFGGDLTVKLPGGRIRIHLPKTSATILKYDRHAPVVMQDAPENEQIKPEVLTPEEEMRRKRRFIF